MLVHPERLAEHLRHVPSDDRAPERLFGRLERTYVDEARRGDHICYITSRGRFRSDYPDWGLSMSLDDIFSDFAETMAPADNWPLGRG